MVEKLKLDSKLAGLTVPLPGTRLSAASRPPPFPPHYHTVALQTLRCVGFCRGSSDGSPALGASKAGAPKLQGTRTPASFLVASLW
jgi:hypothetical protein